MSRWKIGLVAGVFVLLCTSAAFLVVRHASAEATTQRFDITIPASGHYVDPLSTSCSAESITVTDGSVHIFGSFVVDANGGAHGVFHTNTQGVKGVGDVSGEQYEIVNETHQGMIVAGAREFTNSSQSQIIGPGPDNNLVIDMTSKITINDNGEITARIVDWSVGCR